MQSQLEDRASPLRTRAAALVKHPKFNPIVISLILLNAVLIGLETYPVVYDPFAALFRLADRILLWLFAIELLIRMVAVGSLRRFIADNWNLFDLLVVMSGFLLSGSGFVTVLRMLRILRVLRAISIIPSLRRIVNALLLTIPSIGSILLLLMLLFYIFSVIGTSLFGVLLPEYFGSLHQTVLTLFQVILLDGVMDIMRRLMAVAPWSWLYFISFILLGSFIVFNLFVGVIVNNIEQADDQKQHDAGRFDTATPSESSSSSTASLQDEIRHLRSELAELKLMLLDERKDNNVH